MIDFHTHILPNIDDGSQSVEETFNLIKEAEKSGFEKIISTSHYIEGYYEVGNREREVWIDSLNKKLAEENIKVNLYMANEIYITENIIKLLEEKKATTINNTNYVLYEMPLNTKPLNLYDMLFEMQRYKLVPILAHPERYLFVQKEPELIYELIEKGVLMQVNYGSFIGQYGTKAQIIAKKLLENDMIHFLGSDVHRQNTIYPKIPKILDELKILVGEEKIKEITEVNPEKVLNNKRIEISEPKHFKLSIKELIKMNLKK